MELSCHKRSVQAQYWLLPRGENCDLQEMLWQRVQGRSKARSDAALAAGMYNAVTSEMESSPGSHSVCAHRGQPPRDPYERARLFVDHMTSEASPMRRSAATLQLEDVHLLERFYNQLCLLVEAQKASDPLSLFIVQLVRSLILFFQILRIQDGFDALQRHSWPAFDWALQERRIVACVGMYRALHPS
jgi:hypothetical protein